jgi:two-component sensor histidine kinase/ABC-type amino acid transport substrate-binding protein
MPLACQPGMCSTFHMKNCLVAPVLRVLIAILLIAFSALGVAPLSASAQVPATGATPKEITVVMDDNYPPYVFRDAAGQIQGILKDTWALWQARTGVAVKLQAMDWLDAQQFMQAGRADVIDTLFKTPDRLAIYDFTAPYAQLEVPIFFHHSISGIVNAASLKGFTVGVKGGDACVDVLRRQGGETLKVYRSYADVISAAAEGDVRVFCMDKPPAMYLLNQRGIEQNFRQSIPLFTGEFHRAVRKGNSAMLALLEDGFGRITPAEHQAIEKKWRGTPIERHVETVYVRYVGAALAVAGLLALLLGGWSWTLRKRVLAKTAALRASLNELRATQSALQANADRFQKIASRLPGMVFQFLLRPDGSASLPFVSLAIHDLFRLSPDAVSQDASAVFAAIHTADLAAVRASIQVSAQHLTPWQHEFRITFDDGTVRWLFGNSLPERLPDGDVLWHGFITDITERKQVDQALQTSLQEKVALLNEVHHRVKNNLQVITSLLRLEAGRSSQPDTRAVLQEMQGRIRAMALLHETLYRAGIFASVDLGGYLKQLATQAFRAQSSGAVRLSLLLDTVPVSMDQATPCGLLVNELLSNALKHAFPVGQGGEIQVALHAEHASAGLAPQWCLRVSDNGVGLPADFEVRRMSSLGLQLATDLARQLGGALDISAPSDPGTGAIFSVRFAVEGMR